MFGALAGLGILLFPSITKLALLHRVAVALLFALFPAFLILIVYLTRALTIFWRRANHFNTHLVEIESLADQLELAQSTISGLIRERQNKNAYTISYCYCYDDRTFIALRKKRGANVIPGARVIVVDSETGSVMGYFRCIKDANAHFLCQKDGYMDALWLGNIRQHGSQHSEAPPEGLAVVISTKIGDEND